MKMNKVNNIFTFIGKLLLGILIFLTTTMAISILFEQRIEYIYLAAGSLLASYLLFWSVKRNNPGVKDLKLSWWYPIAIFLAAILGITFIDTRGYLAFEEYYFIGAVLLAFSVGLSVSIYQYYLSNISKTSILQLAILSLTISILSKTTLAIDIIAFFIICTIWIYSRFYQKQIPALLKRLLIFFWVANIAYLSYLSYSLYNHFNVIARPDNLYKELFIYGMAASYLLFNIFIALRVTNILSFLNLLWQLVPSRHFNPIRAIKQFRTDIVYTGQCIADPVDEDKIKIITGTILIMVVILLLIIFNQFNKLSYLIIINGTLTSLPILDDILDHFIKRVPSNKLSADSTSNI
ncbi:MAG: hypothetical protein Q7S37_01830 [bacterium]|nr:hypothetical protein [bacterium]